MLLDAGKRARHSRTGVAEDDDGYDNSEVQPYEFYVVPPGEDEYEGTVYDPTGNQTYAPTAEGKATEQKGDDYDSILDLLVCTSLER